MSRKVTSFGSMYPVLAMYIIAGMVKASSIQFETQIGIKVKDELNFVEGESFSRLQCAAQCTGNTSCSTASYNKNNGVCLMSEHRAIGSIHQQNVDVVGSFWMVLSKKDIDECLTNNGDCGEICTNTDGSFECSCRDGYQLAVDGRTCEDSDECMLGTSGCDQVCRNIEGSFTCECNVGYLLQPDGLLCAVDGGTCPDEWIVIGDGCYYLYNVSTTYAGAQGFCDGNGGTLAEPRTFERNEQIKTYLSDSHHLRYIGLTDEADEDTFVWSSDGAEVEYGLSDLAFTNFDVNDCVVYNYHIGMAWNVVSCHATFPAICELI